MNSELHAVENDVFLFCEDDAITCPQCGCRTEFEDHGVQQFHTCMSTACGFTFLVEFDANDDACEHAFEE